MRLEKDYTTGSKKEKGLTLIEVLICIFIFSLIMGSVFDLLYSQIRTQNKILKESVLFDNLSYSLEYMGRFLRMAKRDDGSCISANSFMEISAAGIKFKNYKNQCQEFYLDSGALKQKINNGQPINLTPTNVVVEQFNIYLVGRTRVDGLQPRATLLLKAKTKTEKLIYSSSIQAQTTISARNLDVK
ncbi:MAG: prepilin-type N-terminal cleavage/methylation domain-containing protein [bacterium]|nr:prepilin-type N-terminal cleavage/methylation domain-containing protein [bacterium]